MKWIVTGAAGMLGQDVVTAGRALGHDVTAWARSDLDVTDPPAVDEAVAGHSVVVNCAAWTAVDDAESREPEAFTVNATAAALLARAAARHGAKMVHVSTDYVFDGSAQEPYAEDAPMSPKSAYGRTKAAGEWAVRAYSPDHLVLRTAWLYGAHGPCFPKTIARLAAQRDHIDVVDDQLGQPTWTADVADLLGRLLGMGVPPGTYHATSSGSVSWYGFARSVVAAAGTDPSKVRPTLSNAFPRPAHRPAFSVLGHDALMGVGVSPIGDWQDRWREAAPAVLGRDDAV